MTGMDGCRMNGSGWLFPGGGVATPHGASTEEVWVLPLGGTRPLGEPQDHQQRAGRFFRTLTRRLP